MGTPSQRATWAGVEDILRDQRSRALRGGTALLAITALVLLLLRSAGGSGVLLVGGALLAVVAVAGLLVWLWQQPVRGLYLLFGAAVLLATYVTTGDTLTSVLPVFLDVNTITHTKNLALSPIELLAVVILLVWLLKSIAERRLHFIRGTLMGPLGLYILLVLFAAAHGMVSGASFKLTLQEMRGQIYMLVAYVLVCNLVTRRSQIQTLLWIFLLCTAERAIEGTYRYLFLVRPTGQTASELFPHEEAFFLNGYLTLALILFLYGGSRRMKQVVLLLLPFVLIATVGNNRRAAIAALAISVPVLLLITVVTDPKRRHVAAGILIALAIVFPPYYLAYKDKGGTIAMPARALASGASSTDARDASSNLYRVNENRDIIATMKTSPIYGYGFGKPMLAPYPLPNIQDVYQFQYILPHDSVLWVWMRMGTIGFLLFWLLIGSAVVQATNLVVRRRDPWVKGMALFIVLMVVQEVIFGYLDLQWTVYRNLIVIGVLFGLISRLSALREAKESAIPQADTRMLDSRPAA